MDNLTKVIEKALTARGIGKSEFSEMVGVSRSTLARWETSLPQPTTLRKISDVLELPHSAVLSAALASAGYLSGADTLPSPSVYVVVNECDPDDNQQYLNAGLPGAGVVGVYTTERAADQYVETANRISDVNSEFRKHTLELDTPAVPSTVTVYTTRWEYLNDTIRTTESIHTSVPERLGESGTSPVDAEELPHTGLVQELVLSSLDPRRGEDILKWFLDTLRAQGRIRIPAHTEPAPEPVFESTSSATVIPSSFRDFRESTDGAERRPVTDDNISAALNYIKNRYPGVPRYSATTPADLIQKMLDRGIGDATSKG
jgi:transcriptional regulator with XRE-family HTH domain